MRSLDTFCAEIIQCISSCDQWAQTLPQQNREIFVAFEQLCLNRLRELLELSIDEVEKKARMRLFFKMRWHVVVNTALDYTLNPTFLPNQLWIELAKQLKQEDEALCFILMPSIEKIIGSDDPENIDYASTNGQGEFHVHRYLTNAEGNALLGLEEIFYYGMQDTDFLFEPLSEVHRETRNTRFHLTAADFVRLRSLNSHSAVLLDQLKNNHLFQYQEKPSLGYALDVLRMALFKSSRQGSGSDSIANLQECCEPIQIFYAYWVQLPENTRKEVESYCAENMTETLGDYLYCLFAHTPGIALSVDEYDRVNIKIIPCTHLISAQLKTILKQFLTLKNIPLPDMESQFSKAHFHSPDEMKLTYENYLRELKNARIVPVENNQHVIARMHAFAALTKDALNPERLTSVMESMTFHHMYDFTCCLKMLPDRDWRDFINSAAEQKNIDYFDFTVLLQELKTTDWNRFFSIIYANKLGDLVDAVQTGVILKELPESRHGLFLQATAQYADAIFIDGEDVGDFLYQAPIENWSLFVGYYKERIESIVEKPINVCYLFKLIPYVYWPSLYAVFQSQFKRHFSKTNLFSLIYDQLCDVDDEREAIVELVLQDPDGLARHPIVLIQILLRVDLMHWHKIFDLFTPTHFAKIIEKPEELFLFLSHFTKDDEKCILIKYLRTHLSSLPITPSTFLYLLRVLPGCQTPLIAVFKNQLPGIFKKFLQYFFLDSVYTNASMGAVVRKSFFFLCEKCLPLMLARAVIAEQCESFRKYHDDYAEKKPDPVFRLYKQLRNVEKMMLSQKISRESGYLEKLRLLSEFIRFSKVMKRTNTPFYRELVSAYGETFFDDMLKNCDKLLRVHGIGYPSEKDTLGRTSFFTRIRNDVPNVSVENHAASIPARYRADIFFVQGTQIVRERGNESAGTSPR